MNTAIISYDAVRVPSANELVAQATITANEYLLNAIDAIDRALGEGYARENPSLVGDFMRAAASDFQACSNNQILDCVRACLDGQATAQEEMAAALSSIAGELANLTIG